MVSWALWNHADPVPVQLHRIMMMQRQQDAMERYLSCRSLHCSAFMLQRVCALKPTYCSRNGKWRMPALTWTGGGPEVDVRQQSCHIMYYTYVSFLRKNTSPLSRISADQECHRGATNLERDLPKILQDIKQKYKTSSDTVELQGFCHGS